MHYNPYSIMINMNVENVQINDNNTLYNRCWKVDN